MNLPSVQLRHEASKPLDLPPCSGPLAGWNPPGYRTTVQLLKYNYPYCTFVILRGLPSHRILHSPTTEPGRQGWTGLRGSPRPTLCLCPDQPLSAAAPVLLRTPQDTKE